MSTSLEEKVKNIIEDYSDEFNSLPKEERERIGKFLTCKQILTIYQMIKKDEAHTTKAWRNRQWNWLRNCVSTYEREKEAENDIKGKV